MVSMKKLIIKIGGDVNKDLREAWLHPSKGKAGTHTTYVKDAEGAYNILSQERLRLVKEIMDYTPRACVSDLVKKTGRKQEAVSRDISILESQGVVKKKKKGRSVFIEPQIDSIEIKFK